MTTETGSQTIPKESFPDLLVAATSKTPDELEAGSSVKWINDYDDLSDVRYSLVALPSGRFGMVLGRPSKHFEIWINSKSPSRASDLISLLKILSLNYRELDWISEDLNEELKQMGFHVLPKKTERIYYPEH